MESPTTYRFRWYVFGCDHGAAIASGQIEARDEAHAEEKTKAISLLLGEPIKKVEVKITECGHITRLSKQGKIKVSAKERRQFQRWYGS